MKLLFCTAAIAITRLLIVPRLDVPTVEGSYEAIAHLFVGGLFGAAFVVQSKWRKWQWLSMAVGLSLFELFMFIVQKSLTHSPARLRPGSFHRWLNEAT